MALHDLVCNREGLNFVFLKVASYPIIVWDTVLFHQKGFQPLYMLVRVGIFEMATKGCTNH